jgi:hypothetical protein
METPFSKVRPGIFSEEDAGLPCLEGFTALFARDLNHGVDRNETVALCQYYFCGKMSGVLSRTPTRLASEFLEIGLANKEPAPETKAGQATRLDENANSLPRYAKISGGLGDREDVVWGVCLLGHGNEFTAGNGLCQAFPVVGRIVVNFPPQFVVLFRQGLVVPNQVRCEVPVFLGANLGVCGPAHQKEDDGQAGENVAGDDEVDGHDRFQDSPRPRHRAGNLGPRKRLSPPCELSAAKDQGSFRFSANAAANTTFQFTTHCA